VNRCIDDRLRVAALATLLTMTIGMNWGCLSIRDIPSSHPENLPYGDVVREIRVEGNKSTRAWFVEEALASKVGQPYTEKSARDDYRWLSQLGIFTSIEFRTEDMGDGIALIVSVDEVTPYMPSLSVGFTEENGFEIGPAFSSPNFLGFAGRVSAYARFGGATNFGIRYWDPWVPGGSWLFGYGAKYAHIERRNVLDDFQETTDDVNFQVRRNLSNILRYGLRFNYLSVKSDTPGKTLSPDNHDNIPGLGFFFQVDTRNGAYPTGGWFVDVEAGKQGILGGDSDYWRYAGDVRRYFPLPFGRRHSVALYSLLTLTTGEVGTDIPIYMDFHIGGTNSVRGWPLGSRVGKNQWLNTAEYWYRLLDDKAFKFWFIRWRMGLQLGAFGDVGTAWNHGPEFNENIIAGFGGGIRLTIPVIVMIRIDAAYARSQFGIRLAFGGAEKAMAQRQRVR